MNKANLFVLIFLFSIALITHNTLVTFYIEEQVEQPEDYVQINAVIKSDGTSLQESIQDAAQLIKNIQQKVSVYCSGYAKTKKQCQDLVQASPYNINPVYEIFKKKTIFGGFVVAHQLNIKVKDSLGFGKLVDDLLKIGVSKINSLTWKPLVEIDVQEIAVDNGIQQAKKICAKIGMKLSKVVSVLQVSDIDDLHEQQQQDEQDQKGEKQQENQEQEQEKDQIDIKDSITYYKFVVECFPAKKLKAETQ